MNKQTFTSFIHSDFFLLLVTLAIKIPVILTNHIQEDAFITWKVATNLKDYGVIGFNGLEKISASTTHLYVLYSALFQFIFNDYFIIPILIFNALLFGVGSILLSKILFLNPKHQFLFVILLNLIPPALAASCLGMEYGLIFFLYNGLLYWGTKQDKSWAFLIFPILLIWTRLDTVIFLGTAFIIYTIWAKKWNWYFVFGGLIGLSSVLIFNYLYFDEIINHTITAKKLAYPDTGSYSFNSFIHYLSYYGGYIKKWGTTATAIFCIYFIFSLIAFILSIKKYSFSMEIAMTLSIIYIFAILKIFIFVYLKAYFDWYYWLPRVFMAAVIIYFLIHIFKKTKPIIYLIIICFIGFYIFQIFQSLAISYMENTQRMQIAKYLIQKKSNINQSILLEPAGRIPFYSHLYTIDEVGLVNKRMTDEMLIDHKNAWKNTVKKYTPTYILTINSKVGDKNSLYAMNDQEYKEFLNHYSLIKTYPIDSIHQSSPFYIQFVYKIRPIGSDYFLYEKIKER